MLEQVTRIHRTYFSGSVPGSVVTHHPLTWIISLLLAARSTIMSRSFAFVRDSIVVKYIGVVLVFSVARFKSKRNEQMLLAGYRACYAELCNV